MRTIATDSGRVMVIENDFDLEALKVYQEHRGAIDIETTWLSDNPWVDEPDLISVAITFDGEVAFAFGPEWLPRLRSILEHTDWIMQNGLFDRLMMLEFFDTDLYLTHDTLAMQYLLDPDLPKGLEALSERYLDLPSYKNVDYENIEDEDPDKVFAMNGEDALRTFNLLAPLGAQLNDDPALSRVYQWIVMPAIENLITMTRNGIPVNLEKLEEITGETRVAVADMLAELRDMTPLPTKEAYPKGWPRPSKWRVNDVIDKETGELIRKGDGKWDGTGFNPGSPNQVRHIIFDQWGLPELEYTKDKETGEDTDNPSTNADVLLLLETYHSEGEQQEWLHTLREYRKQTKLLSYFESWPKLTDNDGWLHPRYKPLHVVTGRLSSESPNIQNVPRGKDVRGCFGDVEGYTWMKADYSQVELRLAALAAGEERLLEAFRNGEDVHRLTATLVLGDDSDDARQVGKTLNFGLLYGAGPATLQRVARSDYGVFITLDQARYYRDEFFRAYPGLQRWHQQCEVEIEVSGISRSPLGRIRYLPFAKIPSNVQDMWAKKMGAIREGINHRVQSFASDLLLMSLNNVVPKLDPEVLIVAEVHDEIDFLVPDEMVEETARIVKATMEDLTWLQKHGIKLGVPVVADIETGPNWGEVK